MKAKSKLVRALPLLFVFGMVSCGPVHEHTWAAGYQTDAEGHWQKCEGCDEVSEKAAHTWVDVAVIKEAKCTEDGQKKIKCSVCEYESTAKIEKLGHHMVYDAQVDPTCTEAGKEEGSHCDRDGCDYKEGGAEIPANGHSLIHHNAVPATCTENGSVEYWSCSDCHKNFGDSEGASELSKITTDPKGHTMGHVNGVAATCASEGTLEHYHCADCGKNYSDLEGAHELESITIEKVDHTSDGTTYVTQPYQYTAGETHKHCSVCDEDYDSEAIQSVWAHADNVVRVGSSVGIETDGKYKLPANGSLASVNEDSSIWVGPEQGTLDPTVGRRYLSIDLTFLGEGWGNSTDLYIRGYGIKDGAFGEYIGARLAYSTAAGFHNPTQYIKTYNPETGVEYTDGVITVYNRRTEIVVDLGHIDQMVKVGLYSDSGSTIQIHDISFKDTLCGHPVSQYEHKSSVADGEYVGSSSWDECGECGAIINKVDEVPAAKEKINLLNYTNKHADLVVGENSIYSTGAQGNPRFAEYNIPSRFVGKGKLTVKLSLSANINAFDVRLTNAVGTQLVGDFGQDLTAGAALNKHQAGVSVVTDEGETTYISSSNFCNHDVTYTFDLSVIDTASIIKLGLWWGTQTLTIKELYFEDICEHTSGETIQVSKEVGEWEDGYTKDICVECGQAVSSTMEYATKHVVNLPEFVELSAAKTNFPCVFEHLSPRSKVVLTFTLEEKNTTTNEWAYKASNYGTYIYFYNNNLVGVGTGAYEETKSEETTFMQVNSSGFGDARKLATSPNVGSGNGAYGILPTFVTKTWDDTNKRVTMVLDLEDAKGMNLYGIGFHNSTSNLRIHFFSAYQTSAEV